MKSVFLSISFLVSICGLPGSAVVPGPKSLAQTETVRIAHPSYLNMVAERLKQPGMSAEEAANYASSLLAKQGYDYFFDVCPVVKANPRPQTTQTKYGPAKIYNYPFVQAQRRKITMQLIGDPTWACGECAFYIPLLRVTKQQLLVISDGKKYLLRRPSGFVLKEISLVDHDLKTVVRKWEVPDDTEVAGVSEDGTRIYMELLNNYNSEDLIEKVVLEVSESAIRFRSRSQVAGRNGEVVKDHPTDPGDAYLTFKRFRTGNKEHIIRYDVPCT